MIDTGGPGMNRILTWCLVAIVFINVVIAGTTVVRVIDTNRSQRRSACTTEELRHFGEGLVDLLVLPIDEREGAKALAIQKRISHSFDAKC